MWIVRELLRLLWAIFVTSIIAGVFAIAIALIRGGEISHDLRISFLLVGCFVLALAGLGNQNTGTSRFATGRLRQFSRAGVLPGGLSEDAAPTGPTLTESAVFFASGLVVLVLGVIL